MTYVMIYAGGTAMSHRRTANHYLLKINRTIVWILLFFMILLLITGYGLTKPKLIESLTGGLVDYWTALRLHTLLDVPLMILLLIHVMVEVRFSLMRWGFKNQKLLNLLVFMLGATCSILILYVDGAKP